MLEPTGGLLARLAEFFEAAGERAKESERDDGFDLFHDFQEAAAQLRMLGEDLHVAVDRLQVLAAPQRPNGQAQVATHYATALVPGNHPAPPPMSPKPGHTR